MIKQILTISIPYTIMIKGIFTLNIAFIPLTLPITLFIAIMGSGNPNKPGFLQPLLTSVGFIYFLPFGILLWHLFVGKLLDFIVFRSAFQTPSVTLTSMLVAAIFLIIAGNLFIDNLFQFKQGNYSLSVYFLGTDIIFLIVLYFAGRLRIPFISGLVDKIF